ncbi:MAG TPA: LysE family transporter [Lunatimonas sp.]|nr:LysE family transporter [Lunatimonas sp.]
MLLLEGIGTGIILSLIIGPVFFALIQHSMAYGFRQAVVMAAGILVSDAIYVVVSNYGFHWLSASSFFKSALGLAGGLILIAFGIVSFRNVSIQRPNSGGILVRSFSKRKGFLKGLSLNGINPFVLLFWISVAGLVNVRRDLTAYDKWIYYVGVLVTVFSIDILKAFVAKYLSRHVTPGLMRKLNRLVGTVLIVFGFRLVYFALQTLPI